MRVVFFVAFLSLTVGLTAQTIRGKIQDAHTSEDITSATIILVEQPTKDAISGLNSTFSITGIPRFLVTVKVSFIGYKSNVPIIFPASFPFITLVRSVRGERLSIA
jgi:hypothetical protein